MAGENKPKAGLAEALFMILLTAAGEVFCAFLPYLGIQILILLCLAYIVLRGLPIISFLMTCVVTEGTGVLSGISFGTLTIGMIFVFLEDHGSKLAQLRTGVAKVMAGGVAKAAAAKGAGMAAAKTTTSGLVKAETSAAAKTAAASGRRERWFTERGGTTPTKPDLGSATSTEVPVGEAAGGEASQGSIETSSNRSQPASHRRTLPETQGGGQPQDKTEKQEDDLVDEIFRNPVEDIEKSLETLPTLEDIEKGVVIKGDPNQMFINQVKKNGNVVILPKRDPAASDGKNKPNMVKSTGSNQRPPGTRSEPEEKLREAA